MRFFDSDPLRAGGSSPFLSHVLQTVTQRDRTFEVAACGTDDLLIAVMRADIVPPDRRCAADGCFQKWPSTPESDAFYKTAASPWGHRVAKETR